MKYTECIDRFEENLQNVKNMSNLTVYCYILDVKYFFSIIGEDRDIETVTKYEIESVYIKGLVEAGNAPASRARKLSSLRAFFKWAADAGIIAKSPMNGVDTPKIPYKEPKVMNINDVKDVIEATNNSTSREAKCEAGRDNAILTLMFSTGIRRAEVTEIKLEDVNMLESSILIHGKGNKERFVYFNDSAAIVLQDYLDEYRNNLKPAATSKYLFVSKRSEKLNVSSINRIVNKYFDEAGVKEKGFTAHSTRRVFASNVYRNTRDLLVVQRLLGHSNSNTTLRYIGETEDIKKQAALGISF